MASDDNHEQAVHQLSKDELSYQQMMAKLESESLQAQKEKVLIREYRRRQRRMRLQRAKTTVTPLKGRLMTTLTRRRVAYASVVILLFTIGLGGWGLTQHHGHAAVKGQTLGVSSTKADFKPAVPKDKNQPLAVSMPNNQNSVVTYQDSYKGVSVIVSQQKLPDSFLTDQHAFEDLAMNQIKATNSVDTAKGKLYYLANTTGQQRAVMRYDDLLIFFQTSQAFNNGQWYDYVQQLQIK